MMRTLIATVSSGGGHVAAGNALARAWKEMRPEDEVACLDVLDFTSAMYRRIHKKTYLQVVEHVPELYALVFKRTDNPELVSRLARFRRSFGRHVNRPFAEKLQSFKPDILISTHYLPSEIAGALKSRVTGFDPFVGCVVTDFEAHALWMEPVVDLYCVAAEETKASLAARGADPARIAVTGIPISMAFATPAPLEDIQRRLGLRPDLPTILVLGGGTGLGPLEAVLAELDKVTTPLQTVVVTGQNQELRAALAIRDYVHPTRILGFVQNMHEWMTAATLVITKPGGLTSSEALALGRPLLIINPIPGQESANSDYLLERGVAVKVNRTEDIAPRLADLLNSDRLETMSQRARALGRPSAARAIVEVIAAAAEQKRSDLPPSPDSSSLPAPDTAQPEGTLPVIA